VPPGRAIETLPMAEWASRLGSGARKVFPGPEARPPWPSFHSADFKDDNPIKDQEASGSDAEHLRGSDR